MASSSGTYTEGINQQDHGSAASHNGSSVHGEWGVPTFQHQRAISIDWTPKEQAIFEEGLTKYASQSNIIRYAKIAAQLKDKTIRDVALRCRWMTKKESGKRRKEDINARKTKDTKEKVIDSSTKPSLLAMQSGSSHAPGVMLVNISISYINLGILCTSKFTYEPLNTLVLYMAPKMKKMSPFPRVKEELANSLLPPSAFPIQ
ncbi:hypothetical protein Pfo_016457 [Paulownia fortunei]|nr:hypothetical protein Pfo_016457 [Paulownia fortunei]